MVQHRTKTRVGVGASAETSETTAARQAVEEALHAVDGAADLLMAFATTGYDQARLVAAMRDVAPRTPLVGCSSEGIISRTLCSEGTHALGVMALRSSTIHPEVCIVPGYGEDSRAAATKIVEWVRAVGDRARVLVLLPDGLTGDCSELLTVIDRELPELLVVGGTAADGLTFQGTYQYCGDQVASGGVAAVLLCGDVLPMLAVSHGCSPLGLPRTITRAHGNWVHEIDGAPAWSVFQDYLEGRPRSLAVDRTVYLCLGHCLPESLASVYDPHVVHAPLRLDEDTGAMYFPSGGLAEGQRVQVMQRDLEKIEQSAHECAARMAAQHPGRDPDLVLQFDCAGRGRMLSSAAVRERVLDPLQASFGSQVPWLGLHTYGEIAPLGGRTHYHNYTVAVCALFEGSA